eukprot:jgi/Astpho2/3148/Aster-x0148
MAGTKRKDQEDFADTAAEQPAEKKLKDSQPEAAAEAEVERQAAEVKHDPAADMDAAAPAKTNPEPAAAVKQEGEDAKTEAAEGAAKEQGPVDGHAEGGDGEDDDEEEDDEDEDDEDEEDVPPVGDNRDPPQTVGYKRFANGEQCYLFCRNILSNFHTHQPLNDYEDNVIRAMVAKGHPDPEKKLGQGVACLQIRPHAQKGSKCFHVVRPDGTFEDFSILKTIAGGQLVQLLQ